MRRLSKAIALLGLSGLACGNDSHGARGGDAGPSQAAGGANAGGSGGGGGGSSGGQAGSMPSGTGGIHADAGPPPCAPKAIRCDGVCLDLTSPVSGSCTLLTEVDGVERMAVAATGDLYLARRGLLEAAIVHVPPAGGAATPIESEDVAVEAMIIDDTNVYFETYLETSKKYQRITGSIGIVPRAGGAVQWLVRDIPDGVFRKTASNLYVGAQQISPGIRRYDLDGTNEKLLSTVNVNDFTVGTSEIYVIQDVFQPITRLPLEGVGAGTADASAPLGVLGGGQCDSMLGMDAQAIYAECGSFTRIALSNGAATTIAPRPTNAQPFADDGKYIYYAYASNYLGPQTIERVPLTGGAPEMLAHVDATEPIVQLAAQNGALYVLADKGLDLTQPFPGFVLKITLPK